MSETPIDLPDVYQADLDPEMVEGFFADLAAAEVLSITAKGGEEAHAGEGQLTLDDARIALLGGTVYGVQVIYRHEGVSWRDTLMVTSTGIRLVRMRAYEPPAP